jgi:hypothetical protein
MNVCLFVCLCVCLFVRYTNTHFWTDLNQTLHTAPPGLEENVGYVLARKSLPLRHFGPFFFRGHKMAAGATVFRDTFISVVQLVFTSRHWHYVVAEGEDIRDSLISVILAGVPITSRKLHSSRRIVICRSVVSLILVVLRVTPWI